MDSQNRLFEGIAKGETQSYELSFSRAYQNLNPDQKHAVDLIEGPVLVIAGPGSGKTQVLAVRIANILEATDSTTQNILCLTFTDAASIAMRKRLVQIIGPTAHRIHIFTFHSFCNRVIQENPEAFGNFRQQELISELEKIDLLLDMHNSLNDAHNLKRLKTDPRFEIKRMDNLFSLMKKENVSPGDLIHLIDEDILQKKSDKTNSDFYYQRKYKSNQAGDLKEKQWNEFLRKYEETKAAAQLFNAYRSNCQDLGRFDYHDMILWVLSKFASDELMLARYQERYQYILVDEYQDTNGAQNRLLERLIDYWDRPNVFVVGDDDQAIYKFQGANLKNIREFDEKYKPVKVLLKKNYRSTQAILDASLSLIKNNVERMINLYPNLDKELIASKPNNSQIDKPQILEFPSRQIELAFLLEQIQKAHLGGEKLGETAIIFRNHVQSEKLAEVLEKKEIPYNIRRKINVLEMPLIRCILKILEYVYGEYKRAHSREDLLHEIMHYRFFALPPVEIAKFSLATISKPEKTRIYWRSLLQDEKSLESLDLSGVEKIKNLGALLENWISDIPNCTLQVLFENVINESALLQYVMNHEDRSWLLSILTTFFDWIKEESKKNPDIGLEDLLSMADKMDSHQIALPAQKVSFSEDGVNLITAHSAKGLEFEKVYIMGCTADIWDKSRRNSNSYVLPPTLNQASDNSTEDERRLFFVAMTRAKSELHLTYSTRDEKDKDLLRCQFVDELNSSGHCTFAQLQVEPSILESFHYLQLKKSPKELPMIDRDLVQRELLSYKLSVTGLNKYLKCPLSFYFENILKVPTARNKHMGFGRAVHRAFQHYFSIDQEKFNPGLAELIEGFQRGMDEHRSHFTESEYSDLSVYGKIILQQYFEHYKPLYKNHKKYITEHRIDLSEYRGIPIKGFLDRVDIDLKTNNVEVVDYKTGNSDSRYTRTKLKSPQSGEDPGGDYWRQIVFYKILIDGDRSNPWSMEKGYIDFVEPDRRNGEFSKKDILIRAQDIELVGKQIEECWKGIQEQKFDQLCGEEDCHWCNFVKNGYLFDQETQLEVEDIVQEF